MACKSCFLFLDWFEIGLFPYVSTNQNDALLTPYGFAFFAVLLKPRQRYQMVYTKEELLFEEKSTLDENFFVHV